MEEAWVQGVPASLVSEEVPAKQGGQLRVPAKQGGVEEAGFQGEESRRKEVPAKQGDQSCGLKVEQRKLSLPGCEESRSEEVLTIQGDDQILAAR